MYNNSKTLILNALLLILSLTIQQTHSQANNPSPSASSLPPAATPNPTPTSPSSPAQAPAPAPAPVEPSPSPSPEPVAQPTTTNPSLATSTNSPLPPNNNPGSSIQPINSQSNTPPSQSSATPLSGHSVSSTSSSVPQTIPPGLSQPASSIVILTVTRTGTDGIVYTSVTSSYSPLPRPTSSSNNNSSSGSSSNTWAIIGGIVGGLAGIAAVVFIVFRCTQRRFSDLDDEDVAIKWPELVNRVEDPSTLNPLAARPGVGHGIGEDDDQKDEKPRLYSHDIAMESLHSDQRHPGMYDSYQAYPPPPPPLHPQEHNGYSDDPYLGPSGAQQPYPGTVNNLGYDEQPGYQHRPHDLHSQPSLGASINNPHDSQLPSRPDSRQQQQQLNHLNLPDHHSQYPIAWDGPEDIPLTVVNSHQPQPPSNTTPLHNPYHQS